MVGGTPCQARDWGGTPCSGSKTPRFPGQAQAVGLRLCQDPPPHSSPLQSPTPPHWKGLPWSYFTSDWGLFMAGLGPPHCAKGSEQRPPLPSPRPLRPRCPVSLFKAVSAREGPLSCQRHGNPTDPFLKLGPLGLGAATERGGW